jgi:hypothetical protein
MAHTGYESLRSTVLSTQATGGPGEIMDATDDSANRAIRPRRTRERIRDDRERRQPGDRRPDQAAGWIGAASHALSYRSNMAAVAGARASYAVTVPAETADEARELLDE